MANQEATHPGKQLLTAQGSDSTSRLEPAKEGHSKYHPAQSPRMGSTSEFELLKEHSHFLI